MGKLSQSHAAGNLMGKLSQLHAAGNLMGKLSQLHAAGNLMGKLVIDSNSPSNPLLSSLERIEF